MRLKTLDFNGIRVEHRVSRRLKNSHIQVQHTHVILKTPPVSDAYAYELLMDKASWISKKLAEQQQRQPLQSEYGREVFYLGETYLLHESDLFDDLTSAIALLRHESDEALARCYDRFYRSRALDHLAERLNTFEGIMGMEASKMVIRKMKRRWGSCSSTGVITFNSHLIQLPEPLIDYVVVHELAHLRQMNHSRAFYAIVENILPDYRKRQKEMKRFMLDF